MIPKTLHFIWVGDESKRPDNCIQTWVRHNPEWRVKVWGNDSLVETEWINARHMREMAKRELNGVADMMRWEILYNEGGFVVDADSVCLRPLDDGLLDCEAFACWESEIARPGLIAAGYFACSAENPFVGQIVTDIHNEESVVNDMAWKTVGPMRLTDAYQRYAYLALKVLPSHLFIPEHFTGVRYEGPGPVYAHQEWASTKRSYDTLHLAQLDAAGKPIAAPRPVRSAAVRSPTPIPAPAGSDAARVSVAERSPLEDRHAPGVVQRVQVGQELVGRSRLEVFAQLCAGRRVLHVGCADWPIANPTACLHLALEAHCARLDGLEFRTDALAGLVRHVKGRLYARVEDVTDEYDLILVPGLMALVPDVRGFLADLQLLKAPNIVITVPEAYQCAKHCFDYLASSETFVEVVHPESTAWFTPYTFSKAIKNLTPWQIDGLWFFDKVSLLAMVSKPRLN